LAHLKGEVFRGEAVRRRNGALFAELIMGHSPGAVPGMRVRRSRGRLIA